MQLTEFLLRLTDVSATERVFLVGGDAAQPEGPYPDSLSVIRTGILQRHGVREVGVAGYPEGHPNIPTPVLDQHLEEKLASLEGQGLQPFILTQFAFDAEVVLSWIRRVRARGVHAPIRIGTPGPVGVKRLIGFARRFGVGANAMIVKKYGLSLTNLVGNAGPDHFVNDLSKLLADDPSTGDVKLHLYAFGGLLATSEWARDYIAAQS
jgi:methylenetetrahydrofolate reductase (NADPH)